MIMCRYHHSITRYKEQEEFLDTLNIGCDPGVKAQGGFQGHTSKSRLYAGMDDHTLTELQPRGKSAL